MISNFLEMLGFHLQTIFFIIELPLSIVPPLSSESHMGEQNGKSNLPMPMVIAAANKARCLPKVPTISVPDSQSDAMIPLETRNNGQPNNEGTNRSTGGVKCRFDGLMTFLKTSPFF